MRATKTFLATAAFMVGGSVLPAADAGAAVVSFQIQRTNLPTTAIAGAPQENAHVGFWQNWTGTGTGAGSTRSWGGVDSNGAGTGISATITQLAPGGFAGSFDNGGEAANADGDAALWQTGMDMGDGNQGNLSNGPAIRINATGVPYQTYDVLVYVRGKEGGKAMVNMTAGSVTGARTLMELAGAANVPDPESTRPYVESLSTTFAATTPGHYVQYAGMTGSDFTFDISTTWRTLPTGFQIVDTTVPEPGTVGVLGVAAMGMLARRRRRA